MASTVAHAFERSRFYRSLYGTRPQIHSEDDFKSLPIVTQQLIREAEGITDFVTIDDDQLVMEIGTLNERDFVLPFTALENEFDMERRSRRLLRILGHVGAESFTVLVATDKKSVYFAAQIERVLPWPIAVLLVNHSRTDIAAVAERIGAKTIVMATQLMRIDAQFDGYNVITFDSPTLATSGPRPGRHDVLSPSLIPWFAVSEDLRTYSTLDVAGEQLFHLERTAGGTLMVTVLNDLASPGAIPVVRYDTKLQVTAVTDNKFVVT